MIIIAVGIGIFLLLGICKIPVLGEIIGEFTGFCIFKFHKSYCFYKKIYINNNFLFIYSA